MPNTSLAMGGFTYTAFDKLGSSACVDTAAFCATGTTYPADGAGAVWGALVGVNLNQADVALAPANLYAVPPTSAGIYYQVDQIPLQGLRLQTDDSTGTNYCAILLNTSGLVLWTSFNTTCWNSSLGTFMTGPPTGSHNIAFVVPAANGPALSFNLCVDALAYE